MQNGLYIFSILLATVGATVAQQPEGVRYAADPFSRDNSRSESSIEDGKAAASESSREWNDAENGSYQSAQAATVMTPVQRNAYVKAEQRRQRIAARKWFGLSNSRPVAAANPYFTPYSPSWVGSYWQPYFWYGGTVWR